MKGKDTHFNDPRTHISNNSTYASLHELAWHIRGSYSSSPSTTLRVTAKSLSTRGVREFVHIVKIFLARSAPQHNDGSPLMVLPELSAPARGRPRQERGTS